MAKTLDALGDRMKGYECMETGRRLMPLLPVLARIDGRSFSKFTKGLKRPFDYRLSELMRSTTRYLVEETNACIGYTQSDEISLAWHSQDSKSQIFFDGKIQKMVSTLAAMTSAYFNVSLGAYLPEKAEKRHVMIPTFDARVWSVPTQEEGANCFLWRVQDAVKNSVSMAARHYYSHNELMNKHQGDMMEMLFAKGVNWNDYPSHFKQGTFIQRKETYRKFTPAEIHGLPEEHEAKKNPDLMVVRGDYRFIDMPHFGKVVNRAGVIFLGEDPWTHEKQVEHYRSAYEEIAP